MYFWRPQLVHFAFGAPLTMFDWIIQDARRPPPGTRDPTAGYVAAGVFDASWRRDDRSTLQRDESRASQWTLRRVPPKNFVAPSSALQAVAGRYELFPGVAFTFRVEGTTLVVDLPDQTTIPLAAATESMFVHPATGDAVEFLRDQNGSINAASLDDYGSVLLAKRVP
jgi:hypothetical protein